MAVSEVNRARYRGILVSRAAKELFFALPAPRRKLWRWVFMGEDGESLRRPGEILLAELREFAFCDGRSTFHEEPLVMARREGRREVAMRILNYLNLDESVVQKLMEIDDGL